MNLYACPAALNADAYKSGHIYQYPKGTSFIFFNMTARSDKYLNTPLFKDGIIPMGLKRFCQDYLRDHWNNTFFNRPKNEAVDEALEIMNGVLGEGAIGREHWDALHDLGYLPIVVDGVPEGTLLPIKVPMLAFMPTHDDFSWVAGYLEDAFSNELWKSTTVATVAFHNRRIAEKWAAETCDNNGHIPWQFHDFSLRGLSGMNDGALNAIGHLTSFKGTDNFSAVYTTKRAYGQGMKVSDIGNSVPATEHSVMTAKIAIKGKQLFGKSFIDSDLQRYEAEREVFRDLITETYPTGIVSIVADSYNYWRTIGTISADLHADIMRRDGKLVFRPDSGNPFYVVCGYNAIEFENAKAWIIKRMQGNPKYHGELTFAQAKSAKKMTDLPCLDLLRRETNYEMIVDKEDFDGAITLNLETLEQKWMSTEEINGSLRTLWTNFGGTTNEKGFKLLDEHVGLIYGDSITMDLADRIFGRMAEMGFASSNIVFGVGSFSYQFNTRDTLGFAVKGTNLIADGEEIMLCKEPITDMGLKKSAKGCVIAVRDGLGNITMLDHLTKEQYGDVLEHGDSVFTTYFADGECFCEDTLEDIRKRVDSAV